MSVSEGTTGCVVTKLGWWKVTNQHAVSWSELCTRPTQVYKKAVRLKIFFLKNDRICLCQFAFAKFVFLHLVCCCLFCLAAWNIQQKNCKGNKNNPGVPNLYITKHNFRIQSYREKNCLNVYSNSVQPLV